MVCNLCVAGSIPVGSVDIRLFSLSCVCCQVKVSATCWSLVQRSLTACSVSFFYDLEVSRMRRSWSAIGCCARGQNRYVLCLCLSIISWLLFLLLLSFHLRLAVAVDTMDMPAVITSPAFRHAKRQSKLPVWWETLIINSKINRWVKLAAVFILVSKYRNK
jgi:hypothetical protein